MEHIPFSVLIIVKGRHEHLRNALSGIAASSRLPAEVVVVHMNEPASSLGLDTVPVRHIELNDPHVLPLAKARNMAAQRAANEHFIFLDVDCIPAPTTFEELLSVENGIAMVDPYYLPNPVDTINFDDFERLATPNPARKFIEYGTSDNYALFWSLGFAITRQDFNTIGGFDEAFIGYGGEDTDFAFSARKQTIPLTYSPARIYHQPHNSYDPPLNWLEDIIINAQVFKKKWGVWPMEGWLKQFQEQGYIAQIDDTIELLRVPIEAEIQATIRH